LRLALAGWLQGENTALTPQTKARQVRVITAVLAFAFAWCMFYGRIPQPYLFILCACLGFFLVYAGRRHHSDFLSIDVLAQSSKLKKVNAALKFGAVVTLIIISVASPNMYTGLFLMIVMIALMIFAGGLRLHQCVQIMALPASFLMIGGLALLFESSAGPAGVLYVNIFGYFLSVSAATQARTALIIARSFGAFSCLCFLGVTTPMPEIIGVLRKAKCPELVIDLMYLIYRYTFILISLHREMLNAAKSRLGFRDYRTSLRATGMIYSNLFVRSYLFASKNFDAMESRCYDTGIRFLEHRNKINPAHVSTFAALLFISLYISLFVN
jgi:cobalt/nickel transport system permease protein